MNERRIIHAFDAGAPSGLGPVGLSQRFHAWRGLSGRRYLSTVFTAPEVPAFEGAVVVLARRERDGTRLAVWAGRAPRCRDALVRLARMKRAEEVHVHLIAREEAERAAVEADLASPAPCPLRAR